MFIVADSIASGFSQANTTAVIIQPGIIASRRPCGDVWLNVFASRRPCGDVWLNVFASRHPCGDVWLNVFASRHPCGDVSGSMFSPADTPVATCLAQCFRQQTSLWRLSGPTSVAGVRSVPWSTGPRDLSSFQHRPFIQPKAGDSQADIPVAIVRPGIRAWRSQRFLGPLDQGTLLTQIFLPRSPGSSGPAPVP